MYKPLRKYRAQKAREHKAWYMKNVKDRSKVRFFPFATDWAEAAEKTMTAEERKFYRVHIEKSRWIKSLIDDILTMIERRSK